MSIPIVVLCNISIYCKVRTTEKTKLLMLFGGTQQQQQFRRTKQFAEQAFLYVMAYMNCIVYTCVIRNLDAWNYGELNKEQRFFWLVLVSQLMSPMQGMFNLLVYIRPRYLRIRRRYRSNNNNNTTTTTTTMSRMQALHAALFRYDIALSSLVVRRSSVNSGESVQSAELDLRRIEMGLARRDNNNNKDNNDNDDALEEGSTKPADATAAIEEEENEVGLTENIQMDLEFQQLQKELRQLSPKLRQTSSIQSTSATLLSTSSRTTSSSTTVTTNEIIVKDGTQEEDKEQQQQV